MVEYYEERVDQSLKGPLILAAVFHVVLLIGVAIITMHQSQENSWGGPGGSMSVGIVGSLPAVPMPAPDVVTESRVVDETKGLYKTEPKPEPKVPDATPIPKFKENKPLPKFDSHPSKLLENPKPPPPNAVPYGGGGAPAVPYSSATQFQMGGSASQGGMAFNGAGGGNFGAQFGWYVDAVQRRVSMNWLQATVDPGIQFAPRVVVTFQIMRDGSIANIQVLRSSGNASVDMSEVRAIRASSPLQPLPGGYSGSYVNVEFWFDFHRQ